MAVPRNWPQRIVYLGDSRWDTRVSATAFKALTTADVMGGIPASSSVPLQPQSAYTTSVLEKNVRIQAIDDKAHPACGEYGLFAARPLRENECVIEYKGFVTTDEKLSKTR